MLRARKIPGGAETYWGPWLRDSITDSEGANSNAYARQLNIAE